MVHVKFRTMFQRELHYLQGRFNFTPRSVYARRGTERLLSAGERESSTVRQTSPNKFAFANHINITSLGFIFGNTDSAV